MNRDSIPNQDRQLAAILFADIVGYTSMMQKGEASAMSILSRFEEVTQSAASKNQGEVIKSYGDGSLLLFPSTVHAVQCAYDMQLAFQEAPKVPLRIGIHIGEIIRKGQDIFGNGVNIASRVESMGVAGSVLISDDAHKKIKNQERFQTVSLGSFEFKNVEEPMEVYALTNKGIAVPKREDMKGKVQESAWSNNGSSKWLSVGVGILALIIAGYFIVQNLGANNATNSNLSPSIAVLPFDDMSANKDQEYFADGIAEEILNTLANLKELNVAGRTSSFSFKGKEVTIAEIGKALNVSHVLEGSVRKQGNKIRITAQLIKVDDGFHVWSKNYDRDFDDIFAIQDELSQNIGEVLLDKLAPEQIDQLKTTIPRNSRAYELFLSGKHVHMNVYRKGDYNQKDFDKSEQLFLQAIEIDSTYALAHAGLADLYDTHGWAWGAKGDTITDQKYKALSKQASDLAFRLNPELSYVNTVRGYVQIIQGEYPAAFNSFLKGIELSPNNPDAIVGLQIFYRSLGLRYDAIQIGDRLKEIDPLFVPGLEERLSSHVQVGNIEQVISDGQYILDLDIDNMNVMRLMFFNYFTANRKEEALAILEVINEIDSTYIVKYLGELEVALVRDDKEYIEKTLKEEGDRSKFIIHNFYGEYEKAEIELRLGLEEAAKNRNTEITLRDTDYLFYSKNKLFEKYQDKDWFIKAIASEKEIYDNNAQRFPRAEAVLRQLEK